VAADPSKVRQAQALLTKYGPWINKYRGGLPAGWMAAIMLHESGGNFAAPGDVSLGEVGFYQIASYVPPLFGYPAEARTDPETNVALASLEYGLEAVKWYLRYPTLVRLGTADSWKLSRLTFAVGRGGSYQLADAAARLHYLQPGAVYDGIVRYVAANGAPQLGSQSPDKVASRVASIPQQWEIGQAVDGSGMGPPTLIPNPPAGPYKIPAAEAPYFVRALPGIVLVALGGGAALLYYLWKRR
jgi:hypothetical protein